MVDKFKDKLFIFDIAKVPAKNNDIVYKNLTKFKFDRIFSKSLACLKPDYRMIIEKTFINKNKIWWCEFYSRSIYYKRRKIALAGFFTVFDSLECLTK